MRTTVCIIELIEAERLITINRSADETVDRQEFLLWRLLLAYAGEVVSHEQILETLYDEQQQPRPTSNVVKVRISRMRDRLGAAGLPRTIIHTERGKGYGFFPEECHEATLTLTG